MTKMRQWTILTVVAVIVVFAAGWFLLVKPQKAKSADLRSQAATQDSANSLLQTQIISLQNEERSLPQQQQRLQKFNTQVPDNAAEPTIIRQLSAAANGAGVDLISMTPGTASEVVSTVAPPTTTTTTSTTTSGTSTAPAAGATALGAPAAGPTLMQLPITIGISGTYPNVESFFQSLERLPRSLLVSGWTLCPDAAAAGADSSAGGCTAPTLPAGQTLPANSLGGSLSAVIFYAPPAAATTTATPGTTTGTTTDTTPTTTTPTTGSTPAATATPATTGASAPPAN